MAKILLSLPDEMLTSVNSVCKRTMMNRGEMIRSAIREALIVDSYATKVSKPIEVKDKN